MPDKFQMLPEWAQQQAVMLAWPHQDTDWAPWLGAIQQDYLALIEAICTEVTPLVLCPDAAGQASIEKALAGRCRHAPRFVMASYNDTWCRDYGPVTLGAADGSLQLLDFRFRGWSGKYESSLDDQINQQLAPLWQAPLRSVDFELEGGSIETDGAGTLLSTRHCLLGSGRNPGYSPDAVESLVLKQLGLERLLWLGEGMLIGDDTDSHIDNLARFCDRETLVYATCTDAADPHYAPLKAMEEELRALRQADGSPYRLQALPLPTPQVDENGSRLPASYVNFLVLNGSVLVPVFGCEQDALALATLQFCFPNRLMVPVPGGNLIRQFGGPHCATMQLPSGVLRNRTLSIPRKPS